jgi:hypothetical protein
MKDSISSVDYDLAVLPLKLNLKEKQFLKKSAKIIRTKIDGYEKK